MAENDEHSDRAREDDPIPSARKRRVELLAAVIIGIAAFLTALATYLGSQVDGTVQKRSTEAIGLTLQANDLYNDSTAEQAKERDWFFGLVTAITNEQTDTVEFLSRSMPDEVLELTNAWIDANDDVLDDPLVAIDDPFFVDEDGVPEIAELNDLRSSELLFAGNELDRLASCALFEGQVAEIRADNFRLAMVFLAIALIVAGIAALLEGRGAQRIVLVTAVVSVLFGGTVLLLATDRDDARREAAVDFFVDEGGVEQSADAALAAAERECAPAV